MGGESSLPIADLDIDEIAADCLAGRVRMLNRAITALYDDALRPLGLTAGQLNTLVLVAKRGPIAPGELAVGLTMDKSTLSRNLARMREHGWIRIEPGISGHTQIVSIAPKGRMLIAEAHPHWRRAQIEAGRLLGAPGMDALRRTSEAVVSRMDPPVS